ncbi:MAG TPA: replication factor C large subunit, partial [Thermoplasmatales archaeon]|nr:replication factor C large subunit [Thermoplasmatales archaeon]
YKMEDWTEKYRPRTLDEVIGNREVKILLRKWASRWNSNTPPKKRAVILYGKPGIGKTSSAIALANECGWAVIELNASDARNAERIKRVATSGALNETFTSDGRFIQSKRGGKKLIILDEADNLYERSEESTNTNMLDKGGKRAIVDTIKRTNQPIALIVNDLYELLRGGGEELRDKCLMTKFDDRQIARYELVALLRKICRMEGVQADAEVLETIADRCRGDIRSAIRDLQSICIGKSKVDRSSLSILGYRDREQNIFEVLREIFKTRRTAAIRRSMNQTGEDPESLILWISENLPMEYLDSLDLADAYDVLSKADVLLGRARRYRAYGLWSYALDLMGCGVAVAKKRDHFGTVRYRFPSWLKEMKTLKEERAVRNNLLKKIGSYCHMSSRKANEIIMEIRRNFQLNDAFAISLRDQLDLTEGEIRYLLGNKYKSKLQSLLKKEEEEIKTQEKLPSKIVEQSKLF